MARGETARCSAEGVNPKGRISQAKGPLPDASLESVLRSGPAIMGLCSVRPPKGKLEPKASATGSWQLSGSRTE